MPAMREGVVLEVGEGGMDSLRRLQGVAPGAAVDVSTQY